MAAVGGSASGPAAAARRQVAAWRWMIAALALHAVDEGLCEALGLCPPEVIGLEARGSWLVPLGLTLPVWLAGMAVLVALLLLATPLVAGDAAWSRAGGYAMGGGVAALGLAHLAVSAAFWRWLPGTASAPLLSLAGVWLVRATRRRFARPGKEGG